MWRRKAALALNGTAGIRVSGKGPSSYTAQLPTPTGRSVQQGVTVVDFHLLLLAGLPGAPKVLNFERSVDQHGSLTNVRLILDLSNKEFGDVRPRDNPVPPLRGLGNNLVPSCPRSTGQNSRPRDRPIEPAFLDQSLLQTLVIISAAKDDLERQPLQAADARVAIASSKPSHTDQTFYALGPHRRDQHTGRVREQVHGP